MSWDFETEPEFQKELDWIEQFVRDEVEPLEFVLECHPYDVRDPKRNKLVRPLQAEVKKRKLWACHLGPGTRRAGLRAGQARTDERDSGPRDLCADRVRMPGARFRQRRDPRALRHARAEEKISAAAARQRDRVGVLDDRAAGRRRSQGLQDSRRAQGRQLGDQRREVVLVERAPRVISDRDGGDRSQTPRNTTACRCSSCRRKLQA